MPRIKRWAPMAHGFNRDPEVRELRKRYADWMGYVWLEMCSIGDMNGGEVKGSPEQIGESLAYISLSKRPSLSAKCITNALGFMANCGWIVIETHRVLIVNHLKYHPKESTKQGPSEQPTITTNHNNPPKAPRSEVGDLAFENFWKMYPKKIGKGAAEKAWKKEAAFSNDVQEAILAALTWQVLSPEWIKDRGQFIPHPATYLNQRRWLDQKSEVANGSTISGNRVIPEPGKYAKFNR